MIGYCIDCQRSVFVEFDNHGVPYHEFVRIDPGDVPPNQLYECRGIIAFSEPPQFPPIEVYAHVERRES